MRRELFLARYRCLPAHAVIRLYRRRAMSHLRYRTSWEDVNGFVLAKDARELLGSMEAFDALRLEPLALGHARADGAGMPEGIILPRTMTVADFLGEGRGYFARACDGLDFISEVAGLRYGGDDVNKKAALESLAAYDAFRGDAVLHTIEEGGYGPDDVVSIEPLHDWLFLRGLLASLLNLSAACYRDGGNEGEWDFCVGSSRGRRWDEAAIGDGGPEVYASPFASDPCRAFQAIDRQIHAHGYPLILDVADSLGGLFLENGTRAGVPIRRFRNTKHAHLVTSAQLTGISSYGSMKGADDIRTHICLDRSIGKSDLVRDYVVGVLDTAQSLRSDGGTPLGWEITNQDAPGREPYPTVLFHSQAAALIFRSVYHEGIVSAYCKNCGRGFLTRERKNTRELCSHACRVAFQSSDDRMTDG